MNETLQARDRSPTWLSVLLRLWILRPVKEMPRGNAAYPTLTMAAAWLAAWVAVDRWQSGPEPQFAAGGIPLLAWYALAILVFAALMKWRTDAAHFGPVLALTVGAVPVPLLLLCATDIDFDSHWFLGAAVAVGIYTLLYLARGLRAITGESQRAAACAGLVFIVGFCWLSDALDAIPDVWAPLETQAAEADGTGVDAEALLFGQAGRIDEALETVQRARAPKSQAFFLGFAGVGDEKVFAQEVGLASRVLAERYDIGDRRLSLINDQRDLERAPLATVSGLRYALRGLASRMNVDQDVLFLSISSHGAKDPAIAVSNSQLPLVDLSDEDLADALSESGIKWRVIIISACYAGGFIERLRDPQTIVITAAAADRTSFGCSNDRDLTYFGEAFYRDALPGAPSLRDAFDVAKAAIAARESREHVEASDPQAFFGRDIAEKLGPLESHQRQSEGRHEN